MENMKRFNTTGPCFPDEHYMLPALDRLPGIRRLVNMERYFVIHAPRQTGKTTAVKALVRECVEKSWDEKLYNRDVEFNGKTLHMVGL